MTNGPRSCPPTGPRILAIIFVFTLASAFGINPYHYGSGDNAITIPFLKASANPALYPGDYLLAQRPFYYTYLWDVLGQLHTRLGIGLPALFLSLYLLSLYLTFLAMYRVACSLFDHHEIAVLALLLLAFSKPTLGAVSTIEGMLNTRGVATPLLLFAVDSFLRGRTVRPFLLLGVAYLIHPLTTHYVLAMLVVAAAVDIQRRGIRRLLVGGSVFFATASPLLVWKLRHTPPSLQLLSADPQWVAELHLRSPHHMFPFTWGWATFLHAMVTLLLFGIAWRYRNVERDDRHRVMWIASWTTVGLCALGLIGSEFHPMGIVFVTQPLRSFQFMEYFTMLYVANYLHRRVADARHVTAALGVAGVACGIAYGGERLVIPLLVVLAAAAFLEVRHQARLRPLARMSFTVIATCLVCLGAFLGYADDRSAGKATFSMWNDQDARWIDVGRWIRSHTDVRDGIIVPPRNGKDLRSIGERTVYADFEDGGLMNSNPAFGREWLRRMNLLGFRNEEEGGSGFQTIGVTQLRRVALEMRATNRHVFLVWPSTNRSLPFRQSYRNDAYIVYEVG